MLGKRGNGLQHCGQASRTSLVATQGGNLERLIPRYSIFLSAIRYREQTPLAGIMFTHPHGNSLSSTMLFIIAHEQSGLERAMRLFPTRTGLALADWIVIGKQADEIGASGIQKAGYEESF